MRWRIRAAFEMRDQNSRGGKKKKGWCTLMRYYGEQMGGWVGGWWWGCSIKYLWKHFIFSSITLSLYPRFSSTSIMADTSFRTTHFSAVNFPIEQSGCSVFCSLESTSRWRPSPSIADAHWVNAGEAECLCVECFFKSSFTQIMSFFFFFLR